MSVSIDARGPRWSAAITAVVLATALVTSNLWVIAFQAVVFAIGAISGPQFTPYALIFKKLIKPRLKSEPILEDVRPPQFSQSVGLAFALVELRKHVWRISYRAFGWHNAHAVVQPTYV